MSKRVRVKTVDAGGFTIILDEPVEHHGTDATTETGQEQRSLFRVVKQVWTPNADVALESIEPPARARPASQPLPGASGPERAAPRWHHHRP